MQAGALYVEVIVKPLYPICSRCKAKRTKKEQSFCIAIIAA